jgi:hypothetical protein
MEELASQISSGAYVYSSFIPEDTRLESEIGMTIVVEGQFLE